LGYFLINFVAERLSHHDPAHDPLMKLANG
jgi:hypothetical protein